MTGLKSRADTRAKLLDVGIIPIIRVGSTEIAIRASEAIYRGGIRVLEITMTVPGAVKTIEALADKMGDEVIIGAGTVLDEATAQACQSAGAQFIATPSLAMEVIHYCAHNGVLVIPGGLTPTEIVSAWTAGADFVKVFPANAMGGPNYIKSLRGPLPQIPLVPTGGVSLQSVGDFILAGAAAVGVGGELVNNKALSNNEDERITECARQFIEIVTSSRRLREQV